jgi:putative ABC transport system permease protein
VNWDWRLWLSIVRLTLSRVRNAPLLGLATLVGLTVAIGIIASVPIFVRGVNLELLRSELAAQAAQGGRPLFAMRFYRTSSATSPVTFASYDRLNQYLTESASSEIGLPIKLEVRSAESVTFDVAPADLTRYPEFKRALDQVDIGYFSDLSSHITVTDGSFPAAVDAKSAEVPVLLLDAEANQLGLHAGEHLILTSNADPAEGQAAPVTTKVVVAGIWKATDAHDGYWFDNPENLGKTLLVPEATFRQRIAPLFKSQFLFASWYIVYDSTAVRTDEIVNILTRTSRMLNRANTILAGTRLDYSPTQPLDNYRQRTELLTILLYVFSVPVVGLVLYFLALMSNLVVERRRGEVSLLASRGASPTQLTVVQFIEALGLSLVAIPLGLGLALGLATLMGMTQSFLRFASRPPIPVSISADSINFAILAAALGLATQVLPTLGSARTTIVRYKVDYARSLLAPAWQRLFLDVILLGIVGYGYYQLRERGSLSVLGVGVSTAGGDPLREPILFIAPSLFVFALALVTIRLFPITMTILSGVTSAARQVFWQLAFRNLSRAPGRYVGPLLLTILTLGLGTFTASIAKTLDQNTIDQVRYRVGADLTVFEMPSDQELGIDRSNPGAIDPQELARRTAELAGYLMPVSEQAKVPGVRDVTRVGSYDVSIRLGTGDTKGRLMGIDRVDFPRVAFFRRDFASEPLIGLMNDLARNNSAVLLPLDFAQKLGLQTGDYLPIQMSLTTGVKNVDLTVMGTYTYFPTTYPNQPPTLVANLDYIFESTGEISPHEVWFTVDPATPASSIETGLTKMGIPVATSTDERAELAIPLSRPERIGLFGMLSAGFLASAGLTALGFGLYTVSSLRRRMIEFGVLRAIGLSDVQMIASLLIEQTIIVVSGAFLGLVIGSATSVAFIPFFRVGATAEAIIPPFQVLLAWGDVTVILSAFAAILLVTSLGVIYRLGRLKIFEAVKLGESV